jgi:hypothetical protein
MNLSSGAAEQLLWLGFATVLVVGVVLLAATRHPPPPLPPLPAPQPQPRSEESDWPQPPSRPHPLAASVDHPLADRLSTPRPATVRSLLDPTGFVVVDESLWLATWVGPTDHPPGIGDEILIGLDQRAQLIAYREPPE